MNGSPRRPVNAANAYGEFAADGREYVIRDPRTPRPWVNVIANRRAGLVVSQTGSGFTWVDNSQLAVVTRWEQDLTRDASGRFLYLRDVDTGESWSLAPAPCHPAYDRFECLHGLGYTTFRSTFRAVMADWTLFADREAPAELWRVTLRNDLLSPRRLELVAFVEWNCGVTPSPRREFTKLFLECRRDAGRNAVFARSHMWEVGSSRWGHWNTDFPYVSAFACTERVSEAEGDKAAFLGRLGDFARPAALEGKPWPGLFGRHGDAVAALRVPVELAPGEARELGFVLATAETEEGTNGLLERFGSIPALDASLADAKGAWAELLAGHRVETPDAPFDAFLNDWVRYQAISARIQGRCGYYQQSGAYGFRDQLQDSQVWLTVDPARCREQVALHAAHQFADGSVYHWWHPLAEMGHVTKMTDDLLWLAFVTAAYVRETGDLSILADRAPFLDDAQPAPLVEHVLRAFERVFQRTSPRGLPYIGAGDWNDGLSAVGLEEKGESVWLAHFLAGLLGDWAEILGRSGEPARAADFARRRETLVAAVNEHGWDGAWYWRATLDSGGKVGSRENDRGRIYLNAQTWAVLNDVAPPERAAAAMAAVKEHLVSAAGALLLAPAYDRPVREIGYITRYAAGMRENGGVYTHAATWAISAAGKSKDPELVGRLLAAIDPTRKDPESYRAEPYVLPGNVDGPDSPLHGRAGWTWYTGSAQWLHRVVCEWVVGVRPEWDGIRFDPCLPPSWETARMTRPWRGATLDVTVVRDVSLASGEVRVEVDGRPLEGTLLAPLPAGTTAKVGVRYRA
ncbi:MAG: glycosyl transferase family 36 [Thermoanaerobaculia bacterium]